MVWEFLNQPYASELENGLCQHPGWQENLETISETNFSPLSKIGSINNTNYPFYGHLYVKMMCKNYL